MDKKNSIINNKTRRRKKVILAILDGFGMAKGEAKNDKNNAIYNANPKNWQAIVKNHPNSELATHGLNVGLPDKQAGNSEVGHLTIGSGRITNLELTKINLDIKNQNYKNNPALNDFFNKVAEQNQAVKQSKPAAKRGNIHIIAIISDGGVHGHMSHIKAYYQAASETNAKIYLHAISDGRDTSPKGSIKFLKKLQLPFCSVIGRYYIMDRDKNWQRTKQAFDLYYNKIGKKVESIESYLKDCHDEEVTDEFVPPAFNSNFKPISDNDGIMLLNFRADRARQIAESFIDPNFSGFIRKRISSQNTAEPIEKILDEETIDKKTQLKKDQKYKPITFFAMTSLRNDLDKLMFIAYPKQILKNTIGEVIANEGLHQLRLAESEKYAHVTYFFNGGYENSFNFEERILIPSKKVQTYDLLPKMSAYEILDAANSAIISDEFELIVINFANCDMVGHTGSLKAATQAVLVIDEVIGKLNLIAVKHNYYLILTADHGNCEEMFDYKNQLPHTAHTTNKVPFVIAGDNPEKHKLQNGGLCDISPTILDILNIPKPLQMTGRSLLIKK